MPMRRERLLGSVAPADAALAQLRRSRLRSTHRQGPIAADLLGKTDAQGAQHASHRSPGGYGRPRASRTTTVESGLELSRWRRTLCRRQRHTEAAPHPRTLRAVPNPPRAPAASGAHHPRQLSPPPTGTASTTKVAGSSPARHDGARHMHRLAPLTIRPASPCRGAMTLGVMPATIPARSAQRARRAKARRAAWPPPLLHHTPHSPPHPTFQPRGLTPHARPPPAACGETNAPTAAIRWL